MESLSLGAVAYHQDGHFGKAGFEKGDLILKVEDQPVGDADTLFILLTSMKPKHKVTILAIDHKSGQAGNILMALQ